MTDAPAKGFSTRLLRWYDDARRDLPWRLDVSPYRTLVSELMAQQTVLATVLPYFARFVARFPSFEALAGAPEQDVLALWSGLGYYRRARHLHAAARAVVAEHAGRLPVDSEAALRALPGVGDYTAAVIAAIHGGARTFALDGNAARVVARVHGFDAPIDPPAARKHLRALGTRLVPADRPGDFAQAVMELGSQVCTPTRPRCDGCPVRRDCRAAAAGRAAELPVRSPKRAKRRLRLACVAVERQGKLLLMRRPDTGLLASTWMLPWAELADGEALDVAAARGLRDAGLAPTRPVQALGDVRQIFTHRDATATVVATQARALQVAAKAELRWVGADDVVALALSSFARKLLAVAGLAPRRTSVARRGSL